MSSNTPSPSSEEPLSAVLDKIKITPETQVNATAEQENLSGFSSYEAPPPEPRPQKPKASLEEDMQEPPQVQQSDSSLGKSGRRRRSSSQSGTRTRRKHANNMLKIAIYGIVAVIALLAIVIVLMIVRQSTLQQEARKRQYEQIAEQQAEAQQELRENHVATRSVTAEKETKAEAAHRAHKQENGIPSFLGENSDYSDKSQTPSLYNPNIFGLPSDTKSEEIDKN